MTDVAWKFCPHCGEKIEQSSTTTPPLVAGGPLPHRTVVTLGGAGQEFVLANSGALFDRFTSGTVTFTVPPPEDPPTGVREPRRPVPGAPSGYV